MWLQLLTGKSSSGNATVVHRKGLQMGEMRTKETEKVKGKIEKYEDAAGEVWVQVREWSFDQKS